MKIVRSPYSYTAQDWKDQHRACVGEGWQRQLVDVFLDTLCAIDGTISVADIKEKFGTLNIYMSGPDWAQKLSDIFEVASEMCCEDCGRWDGHHREGDENWGVTHVTTGPGPTGWIKTLCLRCRNVRQQEDDKRRAEYALKYPETKSGDVV